MGYMWAGSGDYRELYGSRVSAGALLSCRGFCWNLSRNPVKNGLSGVNRRSVGKCGDLDLYAGGTNYIWNSDISGEVPCSCWCC